MKLVNKAKTNMVAAFSDVKGRVNDLREKGLRQGFSEFVNNLIMFAFALTVAAVVLIPVYNKVAGSGDNTMNKVDDRMKQLIDEPAAEADDFKIETDD